MPDKYVVIENCFGNKIIVNAENPGLAWSGARWVQHQQGIGTLEAQVSNFKLEAEADAAARAAGLQKLRGGSVNVNLSPIMLFALFSIVDDYRDRHTRDPLGEPTQWVNAATDDTVTLADVYTFVLNLMTGDR